MHCKARGTLIYHTLVTSGISRSVAYSVVAYHELGWEELNPRNRLDVIKFHNNERPLLCPYCGTGRVLELFNISGQYLDDDTDYEWCCRSCGSTKYIYKKEPGTSRRVLRRKRKEAREPALPGHLFGRFLGFTGRSFSLNT